MTRYVILCTLGEINLTEMYRECRDQAWCPVLVHRQDGQTIIPYFTQPKIAARFRERNMPKEWITGVVRFTDEDIEILDSKGFVWEHYDYPRKLQVDFDIEVHEFAEPPTLHVTKGRGPRA